MRIPFKRTSQEIKKIELFNKRQWELYDKLRTNLKNGVREEVNTMSDRKLLEEIYIMLKTKL